LAEAADKFVLALSNMTLALEAVVEALKEQSKSGDVMELLSSQSTQTNMLQTLAADMQTLVKQNKQSSADLKSILSEMRSIRASKETGMFADIRDARNKQGLLDGIKTVSLLAGSVLAVGVAFKIIGDVDFASVVALSISLPLIAKAYGDIASNKNLSPKKAVEVSLTMGIASAGLLLAGMVLSIMPSMSIAQGLSAIAVGVTMGVVLWGLSKVAEDVNINSLGSVLLMSSILPLVAAGILGSAYILQNTPTLGITQFLSATGTAIAMSAAMIGLAYAAKIINSKDASQVLILSGLLPAVALGLLISSYSLTNMAPVGFDVVTSALAITGAVVPGMLAIAILSKIGMNPKDLLIGGLLMVGTAAALMATSHIIAMGDWSNGIPLDWAQAFGLSMLVAIPSILVLGAIASSGIGALVILAGLASMLAIAGGLVGIAEIISAGDFSGGPTPEWAEGTGKALMYFAAAMAMAAPGVLDLLTGTTIADKIQGMKDATYAMVEIANVLNSNSAPFTGGPPKEWAEGAAQAIMYFVKAMDDVGEGVFDKISTFFGGDDREDKIKALGTVVDAMVAVAIKLNESGNVFNTSPSKEWAEGAGLAVSTFVDAMENIADNESEIIDSMSVINYMMDNLPMFVSYINGINKAFSGGGLTTAAESVIKLASGYDALANSIRNLSRSMRDIDLKNLPAVSALTASLISLSVINSNELSSVLDVISTKEGEAKTLFKVLSQAQAEVQQKQFTSIKENIFTAQPSSNSITGFGSVSTAPQEQQKIEFNNEKVEALLERVIDVLQVIEDRLSDISDNTENTHYRNPLGN
jgi:hypothetical protein